jgi:Skp family chaperone for outer membrane proteins
VKRQFAGIVSVALAALVSATASAQAPAQPVAPAVHVAVVDIGNIFKNHSRFKASIDKLKDEAMTARNGMKAEEERIRGLMEQAKGLNVGTPDFKRLEKEITQAQGELQVNVQLQNKDFAEREGKVYMQCYEEVEKAVTQFARQHRIAVVHRVDAEPLDTSNPQNILREISKPVVYYEAGIDITKDILSMLNSSPVAGQVPPARPR